MKINFWAPHSMLMLVLVLLSLSGSAAPATLRGTTHRVLTRGPNNIPSIVKGVLGNIGLSISNSNSSSLQSAAANVLKTIASEKLGLKVSEFASARGNKPYIDPNGNAHIRLVNVIKNMEVEGASVVVHIDANGTVYGINGELVTGDVDVDVKDVDLEAARASVAAVSASASIAGRLRPLQVLKKALSQDVVLSGVVGEWVSAPEIAIIRTTAGNLCLAWKASYFYESTDELGFSKPNRDEIYAQVRTGNLCAVVPRIYGARSVTTYDLKNKNIASLFDVVSTSPNEISTKDAAINAAHNYTIATYNYYFNTFGRDSIDDAGMTLINHVHFGSKYNNAFWDGKQMVYGDGDGTEYRPFSLDADMVAHELTHGVTERTSGLLYGNESGAINEAMSDIFGAMVDAATGATGLDIWKMGEDIYTPGVPGDALRYMHDPARAGHYDWYPTRYMGTDDYGGVHLNSGIANLAFYLLSVGGTHPRGKSSVYVPAIGMENAAKIFYNANVNCLTPTSNFATVRYCTAIVHGGSYAKAVHAAWEAVGVPYYRD